jgi:tetratricopeptide (TPR) repeat protein
MTPKAGRTTRRRYIRTAKDRKRTANSVDFLSMTVPPDPSATRARASATLRGAAEVVVLAMVALAPWAFAAVHPVSVFGLYCGIALALVLWAGALVLERRWTGGVCPVTLCLAGIIALGVWQIVPLSPTVLAALSPARAAVRAELVPGEPESVVGQPAEPPATVALSFDPGATRAHVVKWLAVLALFVVVRYAGATPGSFRRFALACVVNGVALSVFALAQRFSAAPNTIYWSFEAQGSVFGPFVCKNHFPYYVNVCFGLGLGLLLGSVGLRGRQSGIAGALGALGRHLVAPWLIAALGFMLAADLYSLSRGGVIALLGAGVGCGLLMTVQRRVSSGGVVIIVLIGALGVGLVGWFGSEAVGKRLGSLGAGDALDAGRRAIWERTAPLALRYPAWGTGYGTFEFVEPQQRKPGEEQTVTWENAHNDYLETLIEGGVGQLVLVLVAAALVFRAGVRAHRSAKTAADAALVLGGLFGFTAVALHSLGDFGLHMPAVVVLVTVLAAHLSAAGARTRTGAERAPAPAGAPGSGWVALLVAAVCLVVAAVLPVDGWRRERAEHFRLAAIRAEKRLPAGARDPVVEYLRAAVEFVPDDTALRLRLADARYEEYLIRRGHTPGGVNSGADDPGAVTTYLRPALGDYLRVRAQNPLLERPHARLAGARRYLEHPDSVAHYLERATRLRPTDGGLWYLRGLSRLDAGDPDGAWESWRLALVCSPAQLGAIVPPALARLGAAGLVERVVPPDAALLVAVARHPALAAHPADRRIVLARALALSAPESGQSGPEDLYRRAWLLRELGQTADALLAYESALARAPDRVEWRCELAELYFERGDLAAAAGQVQRVLRDRPDLAAARDLNAALVRARAEKK